MAAEPSAKTENEIENACKRMAEEYEKYTEAFEGWSKNKSHGLGENQISDLNDNIKRLVEERSKIWNENEEMFRKETNYGLMKLRHKTAQKHLNEMSGWLEDDIKKKAERGQNDKTLEPREREDKDQRKTMPHKQNTPHQYSRSYVTCDDCGDVFSSTKILELHACDKTSSESEREDRDATSTEYESESSGNESGGNGDEHNQINPEVVRQQYQIRYPQLTNKLVNQATHYYMTEIRNRSAGMPNHKGLCRNEDLGVSDVQIKLVPIRN